MSGPPPLPTYRARMPSAPDTALLEVVPANERPAELYRAARAAGAWLGTLAAVQTRSQEQVEEILRQLVAERTERIESEKGFKLEQAVQNEQIARFKTDSELSRLKWALLQWLGAALIGAVIAGIVTRTFH